MTRALGLFDLGVIIEVPYRGELGDAAPVENKLRQLEGELHGFRHSLEQRVAQLERVIKLDLGLRTGVLLPEEAARLLARPDAQAVSEVISEVANNRVLPSLDKLRHVKHKRKE